MLTLVWFLLAPLVLRILLSLGELIPWGVGAILEELNPLIVFCIFFGLGRSAAEKASMLTLSKRRLFVAYALAVCSLIQISSYVAGYYMAPVRFARAVAAREHVEPTYKQASASVRELLRKETGSAGVIGYAIYSERRQLNADSLVDYASKRLQESGDDLFGALLNIVLHTIPMLLKWILCNKLAWVGEAGLVGFTFWYLLSVGVFYGAYRTA